MELPRSTPLHLINRRNAAAAIGLGLLGARAGAQVGDYPNRPIKVIVPYAPGGSTDQNSRVFAQHMGERLGQPMVIENRAGANGLVGAQQAIRAAPDGYTLFAGTSSTHGLNSGLYKNLPYNPLEDFVPVVQLTRDTFMLMVAPSVPAKNVQELLALIKQKPGEIVIGSGTASTQLPAEMLRAAAGVPMIMLNYGGIPQVLQEMMAGRVHVAFINTASGMSYYKSDRLRALATTSGKRPSALSELPTMSESGLPDVRFDGWVGIFAAGKVPMPIVQKLNSVAQEVLKIPPVRQALMQGGQDVVGEPQEKFAAFVASEVPHWSAAAIKYNVKAE